MKSCAMDCPFCLPLKTLSCHCYLFLTGRFSFYGQPTDVKVKSSTTVTVQDKTYRIIDLGFSTLAQSTMTEIPRKARITATIPEGTDQAVMLVGSASALRWKKGSDQQIAKVIESFRAIPAPQTSLSVRAKQQRGNVSSQEQI